MPSLTLIKVGGKIVEEASSLQRLLTDFAAISGHKLLVHGGGRSATRIAEQLGIESRMVDGRRITDAETLRVVTMVYGGLVNKNIVAGLQARGVNALGLTGADMDVIRSVKRPVKDIDYGYVGDVERVDARLLGDLIARGVVPVMAPLTHDGAGNLLNTNADTIASETARALAARFDVTLVYCFEKKGVLRDPDDEDSVIPSLNRRSFEALTADGTIASMGVTYSTIVFLFATVNMASLAFEKLFQAVGRMKLTMIALISGCVCNILLDPVLIFGLGPVPAMGIAGAALATGLGQATSRVINLVVYSSSESPVLLRL